MIAISGMTMHFAYDDADYSYNVIFLGLAFTA